MKKVIVLLILSVSFFYSIAQTQKIKEAKLKFDLPNLSWHSQGVENLPNGLTLYSFKRDSIIDNEERKIIPNVAFIIEESEIEDVIQFSMEKRSKMGNLKIVKMFTSESEDNKILFKNALGYKATYVDKQKLEHTIYFLHLLNEKKGVQVIMDMTSSVAGTCEKEFLTILKSIQQM